MDAFIVSGVIIWKLMAESIDKRVNGGKLLLYIEKNWFVHLSYPF